MTHVVCVGDLMIDTVTRLPGPLAIGSDTAAPIEVCGGGSAANTAAWLASIGTPATLIARAGDEPDGRRAVAELAGGGVLTRIALDQSAKTGRCVVLIARDGERTMIPDPGANIRMTEADLPADEFRDGRHLHLSAYQFFDARSAVASESLRRARAAGMTISVDAASAAPLARIGAEAFFDLVGGDVLLFANADEAHVLTGRTDPETAAAQLAARLGRAIVKCGRDGAVWADATEVIKVPTTPIEPVDTTGAGDAFAAGVLAALGNGSSPEVSVAAGHALGAAACSHLGGRPRR